jgi:hypothetical protein
MNTASSSNTLAKLGAFENIPRKGSITAKKLGAQINLKPGLIGAHRYSSTIDIAFRTTS